MIDSSSVGWGMVTVPLGRQGDTVDSSGGCVPAGRSFQGALCRLLEPTET